MARAPRVTGNECVRLLKRNGWEEKRHSGAHVILRPRDPNRPGRITVPIHGGNKTLGPKTVASILAEVARSGLSIPEWEKCL